jgi:hypothetical protein
MLSPDKAFAVISDAHSEETWGSFLLRNRGKGGDTGWLTRLAFWPPCHTAC